MGQSVILMGVSGCGKSTVGELLAERFGGGYFDGDDFHPPANVEKMRAGEPLNDAERAVWLGTLNKLLQERKTTDEWTFLACSALRRTYRDQLRVGNQGLRFVYLRGDFELIYKRMVKRTEHYMPVSLLESQFNTLEEPGADETDAITVSIEPEPEEIAEEVARQLQA